MNRVLVINSGSSSLKYQLIEFPSERTLASGLVERIGEERGVADYAAAFAVMIREFEAQGIDAGDGLVAIGHRVVHGGEKFVQPTLVTGEVEAQIEELFGLAPLHNPANLQGIRAAAQAFPQVPQVAVFDTAFHSTLPAAARTYAIDSKLAAKYGIRRFGFHGISFEYVSREAAKALGKPLEDTRLVILHLGNGASACAVSGGRSVETSMGLTPLEGLMMGTRGGDIDPGVLIYLQREAGMDADALDRLLNHESGLLGLGGHNDIRDVLAAADAGDKQAALAIEVYCHRIRGYIGSYLAQLGGADAIVFTAGVGEHNALVRKLSLSGLAELGILLDDKANAAAIGGTAEISTPESNIAVLVIPTDEELEIARQSIDLAVQVN
ncbi:MAG: acetate kinase [Microbacteriaceae bacterium]|nr:acetate kinase [Cryobacterium sp.]MCC6376628.1 acetate kinase [Microbacteriaceae bacterium]